MDKNWLLLSRTSEPGTPGSTALLNLDRVWSVEILSETAIKLRFSETQTVTIDGQQAKDLIAYLMSKTIHFQNQK